MRSKTKEQKIAFFIQQNLKHRWGYHATLDFVPVSKERVVITSKDAKNELIAFLTDNTNGYLLDKNSWYTKKSVSKDAKGNLMDVGTIIEFSKSGANIRIVISVDVKPKEIT